eukprot:CAMPEP_0174738814 /NCGR_PEP_ID=MMETSP1094-20130205/70565_1 /TAXON_ID=156173 /ORGANISM="Chrysochromulina brevifilum, Strain UTEX LB 985" /LENGTH=112 /DNA_ID=CAMNT_0015942301 /DNA_START=429 /DNA_END=767 /DNA_ORIENTATION=-
MDSPSSNLPPQHRPHSAHPTSRSASRSAHLTPGSIGSRPPSSRRHAPGSKLLRSPRGTVQRSTMQEAPLFSALMRAGGHDATSSLGTPPLSWASRNHFGQLIFPPIRSSNLR